MKKIKLFDPYTDKFEKIAINRVLESNFWASGEGNGNVKKFEEKFSKYVNSKNSVAVNSGTAALNLALSMYDIKNKEVILPSLSFVSTANAIIENQGIPKFVDIDEKTLCIDPKKILSSITNKTKVILPVHFGGYSCDMDEIKKISKKNKLLVVEDAAHATGCKYKNKKIGTFGDLTCFSFHPVKNLAMPKGGAITLNYKNRNLKTKLNSLRWCGISNRKEQFYDVTELGYNYYMDEISSAIGIEQLKKINKFNSRKYKIAKKYDKEIKCLEKMPISKDCSYHLYWILVKNRNTFLKNMKKKGIETGIHYLPVHKMKLYKSNIKLKVTEKVTKEIVTIPIHPSLKNSEVNYIIKTINQLI